MKGFILGASIGLVGFLGLTVLFVALTPSETLERKFPWAYSNPDVVPHVSQAPTVNPALTRDGRVKMYEDLLNKNVIAGKWDDAKKSIDFLTEESQGKSPYILTYKTLIEGEIERPYAEGLYRNVVSGKWYSAKKSLDSLSAANHGEHPYMLAYKATIESKVEALNPEKYRRRILDLCLNDARIDCDEAP